MNNPAELAAIIPPADASKDERILRAILRALMTGATFSQIARELGVSRSVVLRRAHKVGIYGWSGAGKTVDRPASRKTIYNRRWREAHREKWLANKRVEKAIANGKLLRQPCVACGQYPAQAHHHDYTRPLDVTWLCQACHAFEHATFRVASK